MNPAIVTAIISGLFVAIPTIISVIVTSNTRDAVMEERMKFLSGKIDSLDAKVMKHNQLVERMAVAENGIKTVFKQIDELKERVNNE
jgi:hypothetical protein